MVNGCEGAGGGSDSCHSPLISYLGMLVSPEVASISRMGSEAPPLSFESCDRNNKSQRMRGKAGGTRGCCGWYSALVHYDDPSQRPSMAPHCP
jgi:hypothetical protein